MEPLQNPTGTQKYQRIIYGIPLYGSSNPIRIRAPYGDAGYATFSPNGKSIAFLSVTSQTDPRTQVWVADWKDGATPRMVTNIRGKRQVYNPHWSD
jgi:Tol biopolymer transport system component